MTTKIFALILTAPLLALTGCATNVDYADGVAMNACADLPKGPALDACIIEKTRSEMASDDANLSETYTVSTSQCDTSEATVDAAGTRDSVGCVDEVGTEITGQDTTGGDFK